MTTSNISAESSTSPSIAQSPLLGLPAELREIVFQYCFESVLIYTRSTCTGSEWYKRLEYHNPCPQLLLVNKQVSAEAFTAMLQACVLDIWGSTTFGDTLSTLPLVTQHIRSVAVTADRIRDFQACIRGLPSLEYLFIDAISAAVDRVISTWQNIIEGSQNLERNNESLPWLLNFVIQELFSSKAVAARKRTLHVYLRCATYHGETVLRITDPSKPPQRWYGVVPKFAHKFPRTSNVKGGMMPRRARAMGRIEAAY